MSNEKCDTLVEWAYRERQNHQQHVSEGKDREEMGVEKPKRCNEDRH